MPNKVKKIKYMGNASRRVIPAGSNWGGNLQKAIENDLVWSPENNFVLDTESAGLDDDQISLVMSEPSMKDVTGENVLEPNRHQRVRQGIKGAVNLEGGEIPEEVSEEETSENGIPAPPSTPTSSPPDTSMTESSSGTSEERGVTEKPEKSSSKSKK